MIRVISDWLAARRTRRERDRALRLLRDMGFPVERLNGWGQS